MDIAGGQFWRALPIVIKEIANSHFISIDLEFSGVRAKGEPGTRRGDPPTAQQLYENAKAAAETFQVLQFGLTCVRHISPADGYASKTFDFSLTPLTPASGNENLDRQLIRIIDRQVTLSQYSMSFLQRHGFRLEDAWGRGVPYLSRREEEDCNLHFSNGGNKWRREPYIEIERQDDETRDFYEHIKAIVNQYPPGESACFITNPYGGRLNSFQTRLIRQCLEVEFPGKYQTFPMLSNARMEVVPLESQTQAEYQARKAEERRRALKSHTGFRFVIEAIIGGNFARDIDEMCRPYADDPYAKLYFSTEDLNKMLEYEKQLRTSRRPVLIGHNHFTDLCFLYHAFIGPLPQDLVDFKQEIHCFFPRMIDTKYMALRGRGPMFPEDNLEELYSSVKRNSRPQLKSDAGFGYSGDSTHEAGYDSWMTAVVFIKQAFLLVQAPSILDAMPEDAPGYDMPSLQPEPRRHRPSTPAQSYNQPYHTGVGYQKSYDRRLVYETLPSGTVATTRTLCPTSVSDLNQYMEDRAGFIDTQTYADYMNKYQPLEPSRGSSREGSSSKSENEAGTSGTMASVPNGGQPSRASTSFDRLPEWESEFFRKMSNKLRLGSGLVAVFGSLQRTSGEVVGPGPSEASTGRGNWRQNDHIA